MPEDASLSDFLGSDDSEESAQSSPADPSESEPDPESGSGEPDLEDGSESTSARDVAPEPEPSPSTDPEPSSSPEPASTYRWDPDGEPCVRCGERSSGRWREGSDFVCSSCKEW